MSDKISVAGQNKFPLTSLIDGEVYYTQLAASMFNEYISKLQSERDKLVEVVKFYSSESSWLAHGFNQKNVINDKDLEILNAQEHMGGKRARAVLKELGLDLEGVK